MSTTSRIALDTPAARRFRLVAPVVVLLGLAVLAMTPGILTELSRGPSSELAPAPMAPAPVTADADAVAGADESPVLAR
jgi:hypothetical protein